MDQNGTIAVEQPTYQRQGNPRLVSVDGRATQSDFGGEIGQSLEKFAQSGDTVAATMLEADDKRNQLWAQNVATQAQVTWQQNFAQTKAAFEADPSQGAGFADKFKKDYGTYQDQLASTAPNDAARNYLNTHLNRLGEGLFGESLNMQAKANVDWAQQSYLSTLDNLKTVANGPGASVSVDSNGNVVSTFDYVRGQVKQASSTASGILPTSAIRAHNLEFQTGLDRDEIAAATLNPSIGAGGAALLIAQEKLGKNLTLPERQEKIMQLTRQQQEDSRMSQTNSIEVLKDQIFNTQQGNYDPIKSDAAIAAVQSAFGSRGNDMAAQAMKKMDDARDWGQAQIQVNQMQLAATSKYQSKEQVQALLDKIADPDQKVSTQEIQDAAFIYSASGMGDNKDPRIRLERAQELQGQLQQKIIDAQTVSGLRTQLQGSTMDQGKEAIETLRSQLGEDSPVFKKINQYET